LIPAGTYELVTHTDNSRCHNAKVVLDFVSQRKVRFAQHPPHSPDIVPSDFSFFSDFARELRGSRFQTAEEPFAEVRKLVGEISLEALLDVFHDWIAWSENVTAKDGNYFKQTIKW
jgi:hypothetical protein